MKTYSLDKLQIGKNAKIHSIHCSEDLKRRFLDLGIVKDTTISAILKSPSGDPTAYEIRGCVFAIRKDDAKDILITLDFQ